jgi:hypothetical protein
MMHLWVIIISLRLISVKDSGDVYLFQHYVIKFVSDLQQVSGFLRVLWFPSLIKPWYNWNIAESGIKHHIHKSWI